MSTPTKQDEQTTAETPKITMKLLVDKTKHKVLFAEAGKECVDFLFHILSLPLGTIVGYLNDSSMVGSISSLYRSLQSLNNDYLQDGLDKDCFLGPGSASQAPLMALESALDEPSSKTFYTCASRTHPTYIETVHPYLSATAGANCPSCNEPMNKTMTCVVSPNEEAKTKSNPGGYVKGVVTFMIMDDLSIEPMSTISCITVLNRFNVQEVGGLESKLVSLDMETGVALLKASLMSKAVLTDAFLGMEKAGNVIN